ncbi:hypothetical protein F4553_003106 [Allocatelliglobosispora scoriae]|uniref:Uncharacterized protein n=1 Tax=Allocatelliglobosispora scoriae TaxID=643052 RepID=A0A841BKV5_9ACTN|nr:hypothetical protein [Allocatelliglobosispora scoriae]MBB5869727.1 hypothetical protein [Allocatelliglobosispora scoriae]
MSQPYNIGEPPVGGRGGTPQKQQLAAPKNVNLQFLDDTWERLLNAMERLEQVTEGFRALSATRLDNHLDRDAIAEDELGVRTEVHLQIVCLQRIVHPVRSEGQWMIDDFLSWFGGRAGREIAAADTYAVPILLCVLGAPYQLPSLDEVQPSEQDILDATEAVARGLHESDRIEERFLKDPAAEASQHQHQRGDVDAGLDRLALLDPHLAGYLAIAPAERPERYERPEATPL